MADHPDLSLLADEDLMHLVRRGDPRAFNLIYERHATVAYSLAYRMTGRRAAAEDVVQEAFLSLWRSSMRYDQARGSVRTWVLGIVRNRAIDALRRHIRHERHRAGDEGVADRLEAPDRTEADAVRRAEAAEVQRALASLPAEQSHAIELAYFGGFTQSEIAEMLGIPLGTIKGRIRLGLDKLRDELGGRLEVPA